MKTEQMSEFTRGLYNYECHYLKQASQDKTLSGPIKASLAGRAILLAVSFILHAEAVCKAVYICFLTIKQIFSQSTEELLKRQKGECSIAYDTSLRSFGALFSQKLIGGLDGRPPVIIIIAPQPVKRPAAVQEGRSAVPEAVRARSHMGSEGSGVVVDECHSPNSEKLFANLEDGSNEGSEQASLVDEDECKYPDSPKSQQPQLDPKSDEANERSKKAKPRGNSLALADEFMREEAIRWTSINQVTEIEQLLRGSRGSSEFEFVEPQSPTTSQKSKNSGVLVENELTVDPIDIQELLNGSPLEAEPPQPVQLTVDGPTQSSPRSESSDGSWDFT